MSTKRKQPKSANKPRKLPPIVIVPDKSYIDDTNNLIPTSVIIHIAPEFHKRYLAAIEDSGYRQDIVKAKLRKEN